MQHHHFALIICFQIQKENELLKRKLEIAVKALEFSNIWINHHIQVSNDKNIGSLKTAIKKIEITLKEIEAM